MSQVIKYLLQKYPYLSYKNQQCVDMDKVGNFWEFYNKLIKKNDYDLIKSLGLSDFEKDMTYLPSIDDGDDDTGEKRFIEDQINNKINNRNDVIKNLFQ